MKTWIFSLVLLILNASFVHGAEDTSIMGDELNSHALPHERYIRKNISEQCSVYRESFDMLCKDASQVDPAISLTALRRYLVTTHNPALLGAFKDGILIVRDFFLSDRTHPDLDTYLQKLGEIWGEGQKKDVDKILSEICFRELNLKLAYLTSHYKNELVVLGEYKHSIDFPAPDVFLEKCFYDLDDLLSNKKSPIFIIYGHPNKTVKNRGISTKTYTKQYVGNGDYPAWLASLDIHCNRREKGTKKDPHHSSDNGTLYMLMHDMDHAIADDRYEESIFRASAEIYPILPKFPPRDQDVITEGIFLNFHEGVVYVSHFSESGKQTMTKAMLDAFVNYERKRDRSSLSYKQTGRDWEVALKCLDKSSKPFLPTIKMSDTKARALPIAKWGEEYHIIQDPEEFKPGMEWVEHNADAPSDVYDKRQDLLTPMVDKAFKDFAGRFCEILASSLTIE
jgi:hypothetical protein